MPARMNFGGSRIIDPTKGLSSTLGQLSGQIIDAEKLNLQKEKNAALIKQQALDNTRADAALTLRQAAEGRSATTFDQAQAQKLLSEKIGAVDTAGIALSTPTSTDVSTTALATDAMKKAYSDQAYGDVTNAPGTQALIDESVALSPQQFQTEQFTLPEDGTFTMPSDQGVQAEGIRTQANEQIFTDFVDKINGKYQEPTKGDPFKLSIPGSDKDTKRLTEIGDKLNTSFLKAEKAAQKDINAGKLDVKTEKWITLDVPKKRAAYVKELRSAFAKQLGGAKDDATKSAINKAIDDKLVPFDTRVAALQDAAAKLSVYKAKVDYKSSADEDLFITKQAVKKKFAGKDKPNIKEKDYADAKGLVRSVDSSYTADNDNPEYEGAKELIKLFEKQQLELE